MTECQVYCLQFTLVRPLTTIISVFVLHRGSNDEDEDEGNIDDDEFHDDTYDFNENEFDGAGNNDSDGDGDGDIKRNSDNNYDNQKNSSDFQADEVSTTDTTLGQVTPEESSSSEFDPIMSGNGSTGGGGTRTLQTAETRRLRMKEIQTRHDRLLQEDQAAEQDGNTGGKNSASTFESSTNDNGNFDPMTPSIGPGGEFETRFPTSEGIETLAPSTFAEGVPIDDTDPLAPVLITGTDAFPEPEVNTTSNFDYNTTSLDGVFDTNVPTISPILPAGVNDTSFNTTAIVDQTKAYFKSPGFAVDMVVNVSIFFAFAGLLKLYHAVRQELLWCRPFPKFLTIKAVVFLTFWQGLAILLWLVLSAGPDDKGNVFEEAHKYQNLLICVEMLLVAISQWVSVCYVCIIQWLDVLF